MKGTKLGWGFPPREKVSSAKMLTKTCGSRDEEQRRGDTEHEKKSKGCTRGGVLVGGKITMGLVQVPLPSPRRSRKYKNGEDEGFGGARTKGAKGFVGGGAQEERQATKELEDM